MNQIWIAVLFLISLRRVSCANNEESELVASGEVLTCEKEWYPFGEMCYRLGASEKTGFLTWEKARQACRDLGGHLASIHSEKLQDFLQIFLQQKIHNHVWIGLNDLKTEGVWEWEDGTPTDFQYWGNNEPNATEEQEENCVMMYYKPDQQMEDDKKYGDWHDVPCNWEFTFICQKEKSKQNSTTLDPRFCADGGWKYDTTTCFHLVKRNLPWSKAEEYCMYSHGGHLAKIGWISTNRFLQYTIGSEVPRSWIGIKIDNVHKPKEWVSGEFVDYEKFDGYSVGCSTFDSSGYWKTADCNMKLPFICEVETTSTTAMQPGPEGSHCPSVPKGWRDFGGDKCYYIELERWTTWKDANFLCLKRGGVLASFHSLNESDALRYFVMRRLFGSRALFIGLYRSALHGNDFVWSDGSDMDFTNWSPNEPRNIEDPCGVVMPETFLWDDVKCYQTIGFICSVKKILATRTSAKEKNRLNGYSLETLLISMFCVFLTCILIGAFGIYIYRLRGRKKNIGFSMKRESVKPYVKDKLSGYEDTR